MSIKLRNIVIDYGDNIAVDNLSLSIETGELVSLLGPSGCGKSTTLNAIAGLIQVTQGQIIFDGIDVTKKAPQKRNIGLVFQNYALYPHLSVYKNIAFPLYQSHDLKKEIQKNNALGSLQLARIKKAGRSQKDIDFHQELKTLAQKYVKGFIADFNRLAKKSLQKSEILCDKYAVDIYGETTLNSFRSRQFITWYDASRAFVEQQRVDFLENIFQKFSEIFDLLKMQLKEIPPASLHRIGFEFNQEIKYLKIEDLKTAKHKVRGIQTAVKVYEKLLDDEYKAAIRLAKLSGKEMEWKVSLAERAILIERYQENQAVWNDEFKKNQSEIFDNKTSTQELITSILTLAQTYHKNKSKVTIGEQVYDDQILKIRKQFKSFHKEVKKMVLDVADKVEITSQLKKKPSELSGGQQQRVAIARAIVKKPKVLLLDEPLSNLDAKLRVSTREWIKKFQKETGITTIFVTHDQEEAMSISDRIYVMSKGFLQQGGAPLEIYNHPNNQFVGNFIGTPSMNFLDVKVDEKGQVMFNKVKFGKIKDKNYFGQKVILGIRPEHIEIIGSNSKIIKANNEPIQARIDNIERLGRSDYIKALLPNKQEVRIIYDAKNYDLPPLAQEIEFDLMKGKIFLFANDQNQELLEVI